MAKIEVILTHSVPGLGAESDQVKVASGFARNYLYPQRFAIPLTGANKRRLEALRQRRTERESHEHATMSELAQSLSKMLLVLKAKTGEDGKMYGSITASSIVEELKNQCEIIIDKRKVHVAAPIRKLGEHQIEMRLHADVVTSLKIRVESTDPAVNSALQAAAQAAARPAAAPSAKQAGADQRPERAPRTPRPAKREKAETDKPVAEKKPKAEASAEKK